MTIELNGERAEVPEAATVLTVLGGLALGDAPRGVAVAVDAEVVPRSQWGSRALAPGAQVEVVNAVQGG